jgi:hypothetical protein
MTKYLVSIFLMSAIWFSSFSQNAATSSISATIVEPVGISKSVESDYGNVAIIVAWNVEMAPVEGAPFSSGISLPASTGTFTAASFYLSGKASYSYTIALPSEPVIVNGGKKNLRVASFTSESNLNASPGMIAGVFVSVSPFNVTVNYN